MQNIITSRPRRLQHLITSHNEIERKRSVLNVYHDLISISSRLLANDHNSMNTLLIVDCRKVCYVLSEKFILILRIMFLGGVRFFARYFAFKSV